MVGYYPKTLKEALKFRQELESSLIISGGTDAMVVKKTAPHVIFINDIEELKKVTFDNNKIVIGAAANYKDLIADRNIPEILKMAMRQIASPGIRNAGTVGGNICNASPAGDTLPVLYALSAIIIKAKLKGDEVLEIRMPIEEFILGIRKIALEADEMVIGIEVPKSSYESMTKSVFEKAGARAADAISKLSFTGLLKVSNDRIEDIRIAFGSVSVTTIRRTEIENEIIGKSIEELEEMKEKILNSYNEFIRPIDDQRSTAVYRKKVCRNLLNDFLRI